MNTANNQNTHPMTSAQFAEAHPSAGAWHPEGGHPEMLVYTTDQHRMRVSFEINSDFDYVGRVMCYRDDNQIDYAKDFANSFIDSIRGHLSASSIQELMVRLARELSEWQFEPGCEKPHDICKEVLAEISALRGFEGATCSEAPAK